MRWRKLFDYAAAFQLFVTGKPQNAKSVLEARKGFKKMLPGFVDKRIENLSSATRTDFPEMLRKSIVIEYYLKGNKTYSKLIK